MTPQEIIDKVLEDLERPDFETLAPAKFHEALRMAHSVECFQQDLVREVFPVEDLLIIEQQGTLTAPTLLRKVWRIYTTDQHGSVLNQRFIDLKNRASSTDYFGVKAHSTYSRFGKQITLTGISAQAANIVFEYVSFPEFSYNTATSAWETDSWILESSPFTIQWYLQYLLANLTDSEDQKAAAEVLLAAARRNLLTDYVDNILEDPDNGWAY